MCSPEPITYSIIWCLAGLVSVPIVVCTIYQSIMYRRTIKLSNVLFRVSIVFYILSGLCFAIVIMRGMVQWCPEMGGYGSTITSLAFVLFVLTWGTQMNILIFLLFGRVYFVFKGTSFALSKRAIYSFVFIYIAFNVFTILLLFTFFKRDQLFAIWAVSLLLGLLFGTALMVYLPSLFIYKLWKVNHLGNKKTQKIDTEVVAIMRKYTVLTLTSIVSNLLFFVATAMYLMVVKEQKSIHVFLWHSCATALAIINFLCIMFSNGFAVKYYMLVCGCADRCWIKCCIKTNVVTELSSYVDSTKDTSTKEMSTEEVTTPTETKQTNTDTATNTN
eukprot:383587_1